MDFGSLFPDHSLLGKVSALFKVENDRDNVY
jgi:hypothetical protein